MEYLDSQQSSILSIQGPDIGVCNANNQSKDLLNSQQNNNFSSPTKDTTTSLSCNLKRKNLTVTQYSPSKKRNKVNYGGFSLLQLRQELQKRSAKTTGKKSDLVQR